MNYKDYYKKPTSNKVFIPEGVTRAELKKGILAERLITNDFQIAAKIALKHLSEDASYYSKISESPIEDYETSDEPADETSGRPGTSVLHKPSGEKQTWRGRRQADDAQSYIDTSVSKEMPKEDCGVCEEDDFGIPQSGGALDIAHHGQPIHISKIVQTGGLSGISASGEQSGMKAIGTSSGVSVSGDKETITAGGKKVDGSIASKSVGGTVVSGEGQTQGGPNHKGSIAGTPKMGGSSDLYEVAEPEIEDMMDDEEKNNMKNRFTELATAQRNLSTDELTEMKSLRQHLNEDEFDDYLSDLDSIEKTPLVKMRKDAATGNQWLSSADTADDLKSNKRSSAYSAFSDKIKKNAEEKEKAKEKELDPFNTGFDNSPYKGADVDMTDLSDTLPPDTTGGKSSWRGMSDKEDADWEEKLTGKKSPSFADKLLQKQAEKNKILKKEDDGRQDGDDIENYKFNKATGNFKNKPSESAQESDDEFSDDVDENVCEKMDEGKESKTSKAIKKGNKSKSSVPKDQFSFGKPSSTKSGVKKYKP